MGRLIIMIEHLGVFSFGICCGFFAMVVFEAVCKLFSGKPAKRFYFDNSRDPL